MEWLVLLAIAAVWILIFRGRARPSLAQRVAQPDPPRREPDKDGPAWAIALTRSSDVLLEYGPEQMVLIVLPKADPSVSADLRWVDAATAVISTLVVLNRPGPGYLFTSAIAERLGLAADSVFAVDPDAPIDRTPDPVSQPAGAQRLGRGIERGNLRIEPTVDGAVLATWADSETPDRLLIGAGISMSSFERGPHPREVFGSFDAPTVEAFVAGVRTMFEMSTGTLTLRGVTLLMDVAPETPEFVASILPKVGVTVRIANRNQPEPQQAQDHWAASAAALVQALTGNDEELRAALEGRAVEDVARTIEILAVVGQLTEAERLAVSALEVLGSSGRLWFQRGVAAFMAGEVPLAVRSYREAVACDPPHPEAWCNLAWIFASEGQLDEALHAADQAIAALPNDPFSIQAGVRIRHQRGNIEGAREFLRAHEAALEPSLRVRIAEALDDPSPSSQMLIHQFPKGAEVLVELGRHYREQGQIELAVALLRRAVTLDPRNHVAAAELAELALSE
jgi:tetratricopeptide (TPR) repeat protein